MKCLIRPQINDLGYEHVIVLRRGAECGEVDRDGGAAAEQRLHRPRGKPPHLAAGGRHPRRQTSQGAV